MQLKINIQHHPRRAVWLNVLLYLLGPDRRISVITDHSDNLWQNAVQTLTDTTPETTHILLLQDDTLPSRDLIKTAELLIEMLPDEPITLFSTKDTILTARRAGHHWALIKKWLMAQAYIMPKHYIDDFVPWCDAHLDHSIYYDDNRWAAYFYYHEKRVWATAPSLVEHQGWNESLLTKYPENPQFESRLRMAKWFIGVENSGLDIDWTDLNAAQDEEQIVGDFGRYYKP